MAGDVDTEPKLSQMVSDANLYSISHTVSWYPATQLMSAVFAVMLETLVIGEAQVVVVSQPAPKITLLRAVVEVPLAGVEEVL